jgi:tRNA G18 (ribose-2'-O)-methylase SpoU
MGTNSIDFFTGRIYTELTAKPIIAAWQIINPENIGNMIRLADNVGAEDVFILGSDFQLRMSSVKKTAGLSFNNVRLTFISPEDFFAQRNPVIQLAAIETCEDSTNLFTTKLPKNILFLLGNERNGLPEDILQKCSLKLHIPMTGKCKSMNVSHALSVALFEWQRQMLFGENQKAKTHIDNCLF